MKYDYVFAENGLVAFKEGEEIGREVSLFVIRKSCWYKLQNFSFLFCFFVIYLFLF